MSMNLNDAMRAAAAARGGRSANTAANLAPLAARPISKAEAQRALQQAKEEQRKARAAQTAKAQSALRVNRRRAREMEEAEAGTEEIVGFVPVIGIGEIVYPVNFPKPLTGNLAVFGGGSLVTPSDAPPHGPGGTGSDWLRSIGITRGQFPTWRVGVAQWRTRHINTTLVYTGAIFVFVVTGSPTQESIVNWNVRGTALRPPVT